MAEVSKDLQDALRGRYTIERELGRGGMATVYLAEDLKHHRSVAIKVLAPEIASLLGPQRFLQEIEVAGRLTHPLIMPLYDSGAAGGLLYYVMPYIKGESLRARLEREKQLPLEDALRITREVAEALAHAHREGLVHRDIKPENILLSSSHALLADFGVARAIGEAGDTRLTASGIAIGTPLYMSPEQSLSSKDADARTDIYGLGCVLYEMLGGAPPFTGATAQAVQARHAMDPVPPLRTLRPGIPESVERAIGKALAKVPADRFRTATELAEAITTIAEPAAGLRPARAGQPARGTEQTGDGERKKVAGSRARLLLLTCVVVVMAMVAIGMWQSWGPFSHWLGGSSGTHPLGKQWILVAEFDGPPDDSSLAVTARDLVSAALDQSEVVAVVPREQIRLALQAAGKPMSTRVDAELARELAYRSAVRAVLEGSIGRFGQGYSVVLRVADADSGKLIVTVRGVAKNKDALIPALGGLAEKLRAGLGEKGNEIRATRPVIGWATPSFEAYRLCLQGYELIDSGSSAKSIPVLRDALALDPDFAAAWGLLGAAYGNVGQHDSALVALDAALRRPERMTRVQRLILEGGRAGGGGDLPGALVAYERALQYDPANRVALVNGGAVLHGLGRFEEALEWTRRSEQTSAFAATQLARSNELNQLIILGRLNEAREVTGYLRGPDRQIYLAYIETTAANWPAAESHADSLMRDSRLNSDQRAEGVLYLAPAQSARGALGAAQATFERAEEIARGSTGPATWQDKAQRQGRWMLAVVSGGAVPLPTDSWAHDSSTATLLTRGLVAASKGDRAGAQRLLNAARARSRSDLKLRISAIVNTQIAPS